MDATLKQAAGGERAGRSRWRGLAGVALGAAATVITVVLQAGGALGALERVMYDWRVATFDTFHPPPSDAIVHLNIDDSSLESVGRWPWPRSHLAAIVAELDRAGAKVIAFDLLFSESQAVEHAPVGGADERGVVPAVPIDHDAVFAEAIARAGNVVVAIDPKLGEAIDAEAKAWLAKVAALFAERGEPIGFDEVRRELLGELDASITDAPELRRLRAAHDKATALHAIAQRVPSHGAGGAAALDGLPRAGDAHVPIAPIAQASAAVGSVKYMQTHDRVVREAPLLIVGDEQVYPHFALAVAAVYHGVPPHALRIERDAVVLGEGEGAVVVPMTARRAGEGGEGHRGDVLFTWPRAVDWLDLYAAVDAEHKRHHPVRMLIDAHRERRGVEANTAELDRVLGSEAAAVRLPEAPLSAYRAASEAGDAARRAALRRTIADQVAAELKRLDSQAEFTDADFTRLADLDALNVLLTEIASGEARLERAAGRFGELFGGRICLIGWTATGADADFVATSLHAKAPGVMIHSAILNAMLTGHFMRRAPLWVDLLITLVVGLAVTSAVAAVVALRLGAVLGLVVTAVIGGGYVLLNGIVLFDYGDVWAAAAGPSVAAGGAWVVVTLHRLIAEQHQRAAITRQFKNYVSPDLVALLVSDPAQIKVGRHELTCIFSDIAGFTTISEQLGPERTGAVLNHYLGVATNELMRHRAYVNKYMGDAIMAFWNAPVHNDRHALDACESALACVAAMRELEASGELGDLPPLFMRVGISTGPMNVGDYGAPPQRSDYTVIGNAVNLASRLEGANKAFGTQVLISHRTNELVAGVMLTRPLGRIVVVGKAEPEAVFELIGRRDEATDAQRELAERTAEAVEAYVAGRFDDAASRFEALAARSGRTKLFELYLEQCARQREAPDAAFDGTIVLTSK